MPVVWLLAGSAGFAVSAAGVAAVDVGGLRRQHIIRVAAVVAGVVAAVWTDASATGTPAVDAIYRGGLVALVTSLGSRLQRSVLVPVVVAAALVSAGHEPALPFAVAAGGSIVASTLVDRRRRGRSDPTAAATAACAALSVLSPGFELRTGTSALVSGAVLMVLLVLGRERAPRAILARLRWVAFAAVVGFALCTVFGLVAIALARPSLENGVNDARSAAASANKLDGREASASMQAASDQLDLAHRQLNSPIGRAGWVVPFLGQQIRALDAAATSGRSLGHAGSSLAEVLDPKLLKLDDGRLPVDRLEASRPQAAAAEEALTAAQGQLTARQSPWLLPPLAHRFDNVRMQLDDARRQLATVRFVVDEGPRLLGGDAPKRYFLAVQSESELRGSGGFVGTFGEIVADKGKVSLVRVGRTAELNENGSAHRTLDAPPDFLRRYGRFEVDHTWQSTTVSPDFPSDVRAIRSLYPQSGGRPIDAVISIDPYAIQAFLGVVGPIDVAGAPAPLTGENAAKTLLFDQYVSYGNAGQPNRVDYLGEATSALWARLQSSVDIVRLVNALRPEVEKKHIMVSAGDGSEEPAFTRLGATGRMAPLNGDSLAVVTQNASASKIDWFLHRKIDYRADFDPKTGEIHSRATITLTNDAPAAGLPDYIIGNTLGLPVGTSRLYLSVYSPLLLGGAALDGNRLLMESEAERGRSVYSTFVDVPPGGTKKIILDLVGAAPIDRPYQLDLHRQPAAFPDEVTVTLTRSGMPPATKNYSLDRDETFRSSWK